MRGKSVQGSCLGLLDQGDGMNAGLFSSLMLMWISYTVHIDNHSPLDTGSYLQGEVFGLVRPDGRNAQNKILLTDLKVLSNTRGLNNG